MRTYLRLGTLDRCNFALMVLGPPILKDAPDLLFDRGNDVSQRLFGVDRNDECTGKRQVRNYFDALPDDRGIHIRLAPFGGLGSDNQLDDEIRWKALRKGVSLRLPLSEPGWRPCQTRQQRAVIEPHDFVLRITVGDNDKPADCAPAGGEKFAAFLARYDRCPDNE